MAATLPDHTHSQGVYVKDLIQFVAKGPSELNNVLKVRGGAIIVVTC